MNEAAAGHTDAIVAHIEEHIGPVAATFPQQGAGEPVVLVHHVPPAIERPIHTLVTSGMSKSAMRVPADRDAPRHLELMMTLPRDWKFDSHSLLEPRWRWPIQQLQRLARMPADEGTWLAWGDTVPNGDPPQPLSPDTRQCAIIIAPSLLVPPQFYQLQAGSRTITFYGVIPLYREEMALKLDQGMEALLTKLIDQGVSDLVDLRRRNVARKKIMGLF